MTRPTSTRRHRAAHRVLRTIAEIDALTAQVPAHAFYGVTPRHRRAVELHAAIRSGAVRASTAGPRTWTALVDFRDALRALV